MLSSLKVRKALDFSKELKVIDEHNMLAGLLKNHQTVYTGLLYLARMSDRDGPYPNLLSRLVHYYPLVSLLKPDNTHRRVADLLDTSISSFHYAVRFCDYVYSGWQNIYYNMALSVKGPSYQGPH